MKKLNFRDASISNLYQLNGLVPVHKAIPFGLQHILAMFVANIAPILIVGGACGLASSETAMLIQSAMLIAGIGTLIQLFPIFHKVGSGLPIVMGISFTFVSVLCFIGAQYGYGAIMGAVLIGGLVEGMPVDEVISRLRGIRCGYKPTSCPDQLATALEQAKAKAAKA